MLAAPRNLSSRLASLHQVAVNVELACCNLPFEDLVQLVKNTCSKPVDNKIVLAINLHQGDEGDNVLFVAMGIAMTCFDHYQ